MTYEEFVGMLEESNRKLKEIVDMMRENVSKYNAIKPIIDDKKENGGC